MPRQSAAAKAASQQDQDLDGGALGVDKGISDIMRDLVESGGVGKGGVNQDDGYSFRRIDDVYTVLSKLLSKHQVYMLPKVLARHHRPVMTGNGYTLSNVSLEVEYTFRSAVDGSEVQAVVWGEATDPFDKATNKAMSAAFKYAAFQVFSIPLPEEQPDADQTSPPKESAGLNVPADGKKSGPMDINEQAGLSNEIANAEDDVSALAAAKKLFANLGRIQKKEAAQEMAREAVSKRSELVGVDMVENFEAMCGQFEKAKLITAAEGRSMINSARARLNMPLVTD